MRIGLPEVKDLEIPPLSDLEINEEYSFHHIVDNTSVSALAKYQALTVGGGDFGH